jgi:hypothetical protein
MWGTIGSFFTIVIDAERQKKFFSKTPYRDKFWFNKYACSIIVNFRTVQNLDVGMKCKTLRLPSIRVVCNYI